MTDTTKFNEQSRHEEFANATSHGLGVALALAGTSYLMRRADMIGNPVDIMSAAIYGISLIVLFLNSTLYHSMVSIHAKKVFQLFDHCSIFLLILGSYAPVAISLIGGSKGWFLFGVNALCAGIGIYLNVKDLHKYHTISLFLYVIMGWSVVLFAKPVLAIVPFEGLMLLLVGGILYTIGIVFYRMKRRYAHFIWHWFVLGGAFLHYLFMFFFCYRP